MRDLFTNAGDNLLPFDGEVQYHGTIMTPQRASMYQDYLLHQIAWGHDEALIFGKLFITKRKVAWYGDQPYEYTYSRRTKTALPWTEQLLELKALVEEKSGEQYNSCLLNLYHDGNEGMAWHSDGEKDLIENAAIGSLSFGAERKFAFKHKSSKTTVSLVLHHGSLLVMKGSTQKHWLHRLPPTKKVTTPRVNLTFRRMMS
ncbi:MAG TPA: alpha-ketoglutarate-dependent dioxygenase AlkB [Cyclobacteriaceae bacterium]|nr:alpha-ketoglutarate-dependent dioxygenase AlkB [Cyclobacteriaceae bacterium]